MTEAGEKYLAAADASGASKWPVGYDEWEASAKEALDPAAYDYIAGGAGSEQTMRANREAFYRRRLVPRMMRGTAERDLSVEILGAPSPHPFMLAPVAAQGLAHADAEVDRASGGGDAHADDRQLRCLRPDGGHRAGHGR